MSKCETEKPESAYWSGLTQGVLVVVLSALVLAFFGLLWQQNQTNTDAVKTVCEQQRKMSDRQDAIIQVFTDRVATWSAKHSTNDYATAYKQAQMDVQYEITAALDAKKK